PARSYGAGQDTRAYSPDDLADMDEQTAEGLEAVGGSTQVIRQPRPQRAKRERTANETRARLLAWSMVVAPLAALVIFGVMIAGERSSNQVKGDPGAGGGPTRQAKIAGVVSFDPKPAGDGEEHASEVANVVDGDASTTWET